jgi:hypothetical protein
MTIIMAIRMEGLAAVTSVQSLDSFKFSPSLAENLLKSDGGHAEKPDG